MIVTFSAGRGTEDTLEAVKILVSESWKTEELVTPGVRQVAVRILAQVRGIHQEKGKTLRREKYSEES